MKLKGTATRTSLRALEALYGADGVKAVKGAMPARLRDQLDKVMPLEWYPIELAAAYHAAIRDVLGGGTWELSHKLGSESARIEFTGVYRALVRAVQYDTIWDRMERAWSMYNSSGEAKWHERGRGFAKAYVSGVAGYNPGLWNAVAGRCEGMLLLSGAKGASVTMSEPASTSCRFDALWLE